MSNNSTVSKDDKPALVFVHGYLGGSQQWADQVEFFSEQFRVITPDLPGYGLNSHSTSLESISELAQYVLDEVEQLGIDSFDLVGHSMGGMIAQEMAVIAPKRINKLILYGTGPIGIMPGRFESIETSKQRLIDDGLENTARRISAKWFVNNEQSPVYEACAEIAVQASQQAALAGLTAMESWSGLKALPSITIPTLVLWGDLDKSYLWHLPKTLWNEIPEASLSVIQGCSHAVHLEKPNLFNTVLLDFLKT